MPKRKPMLSASGKAEQTMDKIQKRFGKFLTGKMFPAASPTTVCETNDGKNHLQ